MDMSTAVDVGDVQSTGTPRETVSAPPGKQPHALQRAAAKLHRRSRNRRIPVTQTARARYRTRTGLRPGGVSHTARAAPTARKGHD